MNTNDDANKRKADALAALTAREESTATEAAGTQAGQEDPFSRLEAQAAAEPELIPDDKPQAEDAQDFMRMMAQESQAVDAELRMMQPMTDGCANVAAPNGSEGWPPGDDFVPQRAPAYAAPLRAIKMQAKTRRAHGHAFRKTMIPLLVIVGLALIVMSIMGLVMLVGIGAAEGTYMRTYGKFFIIASLPIGALLITGAWMFFRDIKKSRGARR
jgi:hypothetical protein